MFHSEQPEILQDQCFQVVSGHAQFLHGCQTLQHLRNVVELVKGQPEVAQPLQRTQVIGEILQTVSVQQKRLQTDRIPQY